ncbi:MAG: hypothetical protein Q4B13_08585 [Lautropia sp.]|nr:hypothetical protein [Lautropia sp.]
MFANLRQGVCLASITLSDRLEGRADQFLFTPMARRTVMGSQQSRDVFFIQG